MYQKLSVATFIRTCQEIVSISNALSLVIPPLLLRWILAWEFGKAGLEKLHGSNWFSQITFPFPFNLLPVEFSWQLATFFELAGALALVIGFATRFFSLSLIILTAVAMYTVHWPTDWNSISDLAAGFRTVDIAGDGFGNYELPLLFIIMLMPLLFGGAGKLSIDYWLNQTVAKKLQPGSSV